MSQFRRIMLLEAVSIADILTATNLQIGTPQARSLIIPVSALAGGSCLSFYLLNDQQFASGDGSVLDARDALAGTWYNRYNDQGPGVGSGGRFYVDGSDVGGYSSGVIVGAYRNKYDLYVVRFPGVPRAEGFLYLFMDSDGHNSPDKPLHLADVRVYDYVLSPGQIAQPLLPADYSARYTFADYQPGDTQATDSSGNGNHAVIYY